jgi:hypothetical protein
LLLLGCFDRFLWFLWFFLILPGTELLEWNLTFLLLEIEEQDGFIDDLFKSLLMRHTLDLTLNFNANLIHTKVVLPLRPMKSIDSPSSPWPTCLGISVIDT